MKFFTEEFSVINTEGMTDSEKRHFTVSSVIANSGYIHSSTLSHSVKGCRRKRARTAPECLPADDSQITTGKRACPVEKSGRVLEKLTD